jgi:hypothetical protein
MNTLFSNLKSILQYVCNRRVRELRKAKSLACYLAEVNNERFFVMPDWTGTIRVLSREKIKELKKLGVLSKSVNIYHLEKEALFIADPPLVTRRKHIVKPK